MDALVYRYSCQGHVHYCITLKVFQLFSYIFQMHEEFWLLAIFFLKCILVKYERKLSFGVWLSKNKLGLGLCHMLNRFRPWTNIYLGPVIACKYHNLSLVRAQRTLCIFRSLRTIPAKKVRGTLAWNLRAAHRRKWPRQIPSSWCCFRLSAAFAGVRFVAYAHEANLTFLFQKLINFIQKMINLKKLLSKWPLEWSIMAVRAKDGRVWFLFDRFTVFFVSTQNRDKQCLLSTLSLEIMAIKNTITMYRWPFVHLWPTDRDYNNVI